MGGAHKHQSRSGPAATFRPPASRRSEDEGVPTMTRSRSFGTGRSWTQVVTVVGALTTTIGAVLSTPASSQPLVAAPLVPHAESGAGGSEQLDARLVHRYKLDETSGTVLADSGRAGAAGKASLVHPEKATLTGKGVRFNPDSYDGALDGAYVAPAQQHHRRPVRGDGRLRRVDRPGERRQPPDVEFRQQVRPLRRRHRRAGGPVRLQHAAVPRRRGLRQHPADPRPPPGRRVEARDVRPVPEPERDELDRHPVRGRRAARPGHEPDAARVGEPGGGHELQLPGPLAEQRGLRVPRHLAGLPGLRPRRERGRSDGPRRRIRVGGSAG